MKEIIKELTELRAENKKVYLLSDGSHKAVYYAKPVHYLNEQTNEYVQTDSQTPSLANEGFTQNIRSFSWLSDSGVNENTSVHRISGNDEHRMLLEFDISDIERKYITEAALVLTQRADENDANSGTRFGVYSVSGKASDLTYSSLEKGILQDYSKMYSNIQKYKFNVAHFINEKGGKGLLCVKSLDQASDGCYVDLYGVNSEYPPVVEIEYTPEYKTESKNKNVSVKLGTLGTAYVDLNLGNFMMQFDYHTVGGGAFPLNLITTYDSRFKDRQYTGNSVYEHCAPYGMDMGKGFRLNALRSMCENKYYTDENGNLSEFEAKDNVYVSKSDDSVIFSPESRALKLGEETVTFDNDGRILSVSDEYSNTQTFVYDESKKIKEINGPSDSTLFEYEGNKISKIHHPAGVIYHFYTNDNLTCIVADKCYLNLEYNSENLVTKAKLFTDSGELISEISIHYTADGKVESINVNGLEYTIEYAPYANRTTVTEQSEERTIKTVYVFDDSGDCESEFSTYKNENNAFVPFDPPCENIICDYTFKNGSWAPYHCDNTEVSFPENEKLSCFGADFARICIKEAADLKGIQAVTHSFPAGKYCFSAFVKAAEEFTDSNFPGVSLRVTDTSGNVISKSEVFNSVGETYTRLYTSFELTEEKILRFLVVTNGKGTAYADGVFVNEGEFPAKYNLLNNSSFENGLSGWETANITGIAQVTNEKKMYGSKSLSFVSYSNEPLKVYQSIPVKSDKSIRESFTFSGFARATTFKPIDKSEDFENYNPPVFKLYAEIVYEDQSTETFESNLSPYTTDWQYASVSFCKSKFEAVEKVVVYCDFSYNIRDDKAYFDGLSLCRDSVEFDLNSSDFEEYAEDETAFSEPENDAKPDFEEAVNEKGLPITETTFSEDAFGTIYTSYGYNESGSLERKTDSRGFATQYVSNDSVGNFSEIINREGNVTRYSYDDYGRVKYINESGNSVDYIYTGHSGASEIMRGDGQTYHLEYTPSGDISSIGIDGKAEKLAEYTYNQGSGNLKTVTYANGHTMKAVYNAKGQLIAEKWYADKECQTLIAHYKYVYDSEGNVARSIDLLSSKEYNYIYTEGNITSAFEYAVSLTGEVVTSKTLVSSIVYIYDKEGSLKQKKITLPTGIETVTDYFENQTENTVGTSKYISRSKSDGLSRKLYEELVLPETVLYRKFDYLEGQITQEHKQYGKVVGAPTTNLVSKIEFSGGRTLEYEYDKEERITKVTELNEDTVVTVTEYTYDELGQLLTETVNGSLVNTMTYDGYGNILSKNGVVYAYEDEKWKDKLTKVGENSITYDAQGNPISYLGHELSWEKGRQLASYDNISFVYNANGIRTSKTVDGVTHTYTLDGTKILREFFGGRTLVPLYDNEDNVCGINYNGNSYYFIKNLQGDVTHITDADGKIGVQYNYDAFGKPTSTTVFDTAFNSIAYYNPYRYRSYYYDVETGLYYLQSRYYDPEIGRFLNSDDPMFLGATGNIASYNLFAYCENNPVNYKDPSGYGPAGTIIGAILGFGLGALLVPRVADLLKLKGCGRKVFIALGVAALTGLGAYVGNYVGEAIFAIYKAGGAFALKINKAIANGIAKIVGGSLEAAKGNGWTIKIGKYMLRVMTSGGGRTNYFRLSHITKGTLTILGKFSGDRGLTHIPITFSNIIKIINLILKLLKK